MAVDVTNTQTGQDPEVHFIAKDTDKYDKNVKVPAAIVGAPTDPPAKTTKPTDPPAKGKGASSGAAIGTVGQATVEGLNEANQQGDYNGSAEQTVESEGTPYYDDPTEKFVSPNDEYWGKIHGYLSSLPGSNKNITVENLKNRANGDDEYLKKLHHEIRIKSYDKPLDFTVDKDFETFKNTLTLTEDIKGYKGVSTEIIGDARKEESEVWRPGVTKTALEIRPTETEDLTP